LRPSSDLHRKITVMGQNCAHCQKMGTCKNGAGGDSCDSCAKKAGQPGGWFGFGRNIPPPSKMGLPCGVCDGTGWAEPGTERLSKMIAPLLALFIIIIALLIVLAVSMRSEHEAEILTLIGTLAGSITGYYFGGRHVVREAKAKTPAA
jgi:hypothetical protein